MHRSPYFGQSVEFQQHREYVPGDDLRHVDWKVWARQDRVYVKQFEEDTNLRCTLLVDVSHSMAYGRGPLNKYEYAATLAASLAYLLLKQNDAVGSFAFDERVRMQVPIRSKRNHLLSIVESLEISRPRDKTDMYAIFRQVAEGTPRRGMMILFSDLLADRDGTLRGLKMLRQRGHDLLVFHILDDDELDFPFAGPTRFEGLETADALNCNPRALREGYLEAMRQFLDRVRLDCAHNMIDYSLVRTSEPMDAALAAYLSNRLGMHHRN
jgi:uncharacterized protein (DUF58 family)